MSLKHGPFDESLRTRLYRSEYPNSVVDEQPPAKTAFPFHVRTVATQQKSPQQETVSQIPSKKPAPKQKQQLKAAGNTAPAGQHTVVDKAMVKGVISAVDPISSQTLGTSPERTLYRVVLKIIDAEDISGYPNILRERAGQDVTCFSDIALNRESIGTRIRGLVEYRGDVRSRLFWISAIEPLDGTPVTQ